MVEVLVTYKVPLSPFIVGTRREWARTTLTYALAFGPAVLALVGLSSVHRPIAQRLEMFIAKGLLVLLRIDLDLDGTEHIDASQAYVVAPLHEGFADVLVLLALGLPLRFVALDEIGDDWPLLRLYLRATDHVLVPADKPRTAFRRLVESLSTLGSDSLVVFPQGTILGIETAFKPGFRRVAERLDRPVLPVVISGTHRVWEHPFSPVLRYGERVTVRVLAPLPASEIDVAALSQEMKRVALEPSSATPRRYVPERDGPWSGYQFEIDEAFTLTR